MRYLMLLLALAAGSASAQIAVDTAWARERMAAFKAPRIVEFVDELPRTATGKVFWRKLQEEENRK